MKIDSENRKKLSQVGKEIQKDKTSSKLLINTESDNEEISRILKMVKVNGKLSLDDQITYMKYKGIEFKHINEEKAKEYLSKNTYYYKVTAFRKNINKKNGSYVGLDFGMLNDLATIDMYLRYILIKLNLDIEHSLKALLVNAITDSKSEDGYSIVSEYNEYCKNKLLSENPKFDITNYISVDRKIMSRNKESTGYHYELYEKRKNNPPIWVLIELMSFGELIRFIEFYYETNKSNKNIFTEAYDLLKYTKNFRDSAAHSRPLLLNIALKKQIKPTQEVTEYAQKSGVEKLERKQIISNKKIHDFICILMLHEKYISSKDMKEDRKGELSRLKTRCSKRSNYYSEQKELKEVYKVFCKVVAKYHS